MSIYSELKIKEPLLNGLKINDKEVEELRKKLPSELVPNWFINILKEFSLVKVCFSLDEDHDKSCLGVDMKWLSPKQIIDEALNTYPGKSVLSLGYLPVASCLVGSGDPYFLKIKENIDPPLVRVPHELASDKEIYPENEIEVVCESLSQFISISSID